MLGDMLHMGDEKGSGVEEALQDIFLSNWMNGSDVDCGDAGPSLGLWRSNWIVFFL